MDMAFNCSPAGFWKQTCIQDRNHFFIELTPRCNGNPNYITFLAPLLLLQFNSTSSIHTAVLWDYSQSCHGVSRRCPDPSQPGNPWKRCGRCLLVTLPDWRRNRPTCPATRSTTQTQSSVLTIPTTFETLPQGQVHFRSIQNSIFPQS